MIDLSIPGWGNMEIENIVLDLNGTIATDGKIPLEVKGKIKSLSETVKVYVLTADTQGTASKEITDIKAELLRVSEEDSAEVKLRVLKSLAPEKTVVIGNGNNDRLILREAALGIAVLGDEGMPVSTMKHADILVKNIFRCFRSFFETKKTHCNIEGVIELKAKVQLLRHGRGAFCCYKKIT